MHLGGGFMKYSETNNQLKIKQNRYFLGGVIVTSIMAIQGIYIIFGLLPFEDGYTAANILGLVFVLVWESFVIFAVIWSIKQCSKYIVISKEGVSCCTLLSKEKVLWDDIKDWGLSYCGQTRGEGNTYYLYFSKHECPNKNDCKKKLKGKMIKFILFGEEYQEVLNFVIPFCSEKTNVKPFVGKDKYHFI